METSLTSQLQRALRDSQVQNQKLREQLTREQHRRRQNICYFQQQIQDIHSKCKEQADTIAQLKLQNRKLSKGQQHNWAKQGIRREKENVSSNISSNISGKISGNSSGNSSEQPKLLQLYNELEKCVYFFYFRLSNEWELRDFDEFRKQLENQKGKNASIDRAWLLVDKLGSRLRQFERQLKFDYFNQSSIPQVRLLHQIQQQYTNLDEIPFLSSPSTSQERAELSRRIQSIKRSLK